MGLRAWFGMLFSSQTASTRIEWFIVRFDDQNIMLEVAAPGQAPWDEKIAWTSIQQICFQCEDMWVSDGINIFSSQRSESYVIPTEARGGDELWQEILRRKLFDSDMAIDAMSSTDGLYC